MVCNEVDTKEANDVEETEGPTGGCDKDNHKKNKVR